MITIYSEELKNHLKKKIYSCYMLLGEDIVLLNNSQDLILRYAKNKNFTNKIFIYIEKNSDWIKILSFYKKQDLFFEKTILIVSIHINKPHILLTEIIKKIIHFTHQDILIIFKFNKLSYILKEKKYINILNHNSIIINCILIDQNHFIRWIKHEIQEKKINIEKEALLLLCQHYEGNTLLLYQILNIFLITWPNKHITRKKIYQVINHMSIFTPIHWIDAIFSGNKEKAIYILQMFNQQKKNPLLLIRYLQKDLFKILYIKHNKNINISTFLQENNIWAERHKNFISAIKNYNYKNYFKVIRILAQIEIQIKEKYNYSVWTKLKTLTLLLC